MPSRMLKDRRSVLSCSSQPILEAGIRQDSRFHKSLKVANFAMWRFWAHRSSTYAGGTAGVSRFRMRTRL